MTETKDIIKLDNYDSEDIGDVIVKLEKSFGLEFNNDTFFKVKTFGDLCDVIEEHITYENRDDCTNQQAFYRIRAAISFTQLVNKSELTVESKLIDLFPRHNRRQKIREFQNYLGTKVKILTYPDWLALIFGIGFFLS